MAHLSIDLVTAHTDAVDGGLLDEKGKGDTRLSRDPDAIAHDVRKVLAEIVASRHAGLPLFFTIARTMIPMRDHDVVMVALDPR